MVKSLLILLGLMSPDLSASVAVNASYTLHTSQEAAPKKCCGMCKRGKIVHGDGHVTDCPCPDTCSCKSVTHPPVILPPSVLKRECRDCKPAK